MSSDIKMKRVTATAHWLWAAPVSSSYSDDHRRGAVHITDALAGSAVDLDLSPTAPTLRTFPIWDLSS